MTLLEMAKDYRHQIDVLTEHIKIVEELPPGVQICGINQTKALALLRSMLRETRDLAVWCEHYYDPSYYHTEAYRI